MTTLTTIPATAMALWMSSLFSTINHSPAIKEVISIVGLCIFSFRHEIPVSIASLQWTVMAISIALAAFAALASTGFERSRLLEVKPPEEARLQSEPVFFRCRTNHTRLFPKRHSLAYSVLEVGIPLSFKGSIGRLFSFNSGYHDNDDSKWCIFSVDSRDYLRRGNETLEDKMGTFLRENGMNIEDYPTVYLVTAPRFLGYQFIPVSFWYLKDKDSVLCLVVVEVNNTFDERHMYILRPSNNFTDSTDSSEGGRHASISNSFPKTFHVSPFNDRTGKYHVLTRDPLSTQGDSKGLVNTTITLYDDFDNKKLVAALHSVASPIFMSDLSMSIGASSLFVINYGWSGLLTVPRIFWEAAQLFGVKKLKVYFRPEVKGTTVSRHATALEIKLEIYFRKYLQSRVRDHHRPIVVHYNAAGTGSLPQKQTFRSFPDSPMVTGEAEIIIFSPRFYVTWAANKSMQQTLVSEVLSKAEERRSIEVSNIKLITSLLGESEGVMEGDYEGYPGRRLTWYLIGGMREWAFSRQRTSTKAIKRLVPCPCSPSEIDRRILLLPDVEPRAYENCVIQALLVETVGFGDETLLRSYDLVIRGVLIYLAWRGFIEADTLKPWWAIGGLVAWRMLKGVF